MRAITIRQPFAWLIAERIKPVENRSRNFVGKHIGQRIAIHASAAGGWEVTGDVQRVAADLRLHVDDGVEMANQCGHIIATAIIDRVVEHGDGDPMNADRFRTADRFGIVLRDVMKLPEPIQAKGALGLWALTGEQERDVLAQLGAMGITPDAGGQP